VGFVLGITHEVGVPLFLVILPLKSRGKLSNLVVFGGARVLVVELDFVSIPDDLVGLRLKSFWA
jgi:hypothetical protein